MYSIQDSKQDEHSVYTAKNKDGFYGEAILDYARRWGGMMEAAMKNGAKLDKTLYSSTSNAADTDGITGFMFGAAASELSHFWIHGEAFRRIHNGEYGVEGDGVVNPAVLVIRD